jgi:catechol 2,3-dioxygenase-like lactoylglutathione lyase family enzyme
MNPDHLSILVSSFEISMPFYDALLPLMGFDKIRPHIWKNADGFFIQLRQADLGTSPYERYGAGMNHIGFGAPDAKTVVLIRDSMRALGFDAPDIQSLNGASALFMKDPDGIRFEITFCPPGMDVVS